MKHLYGKAKKRYEANRKRKLKEEQELAASFVVQDEVVRDDSLARKVKEEAINKKFK